MSPTRISLNGDENEYREFEETHVTEMETLRPELSELLLLLEEIEEDRRTAAVEEEEAD